MTRPAFETALLRERFGEPNRAYRIAAERIAEAKRIAQATRSTAEQVWRALPEDPAATKHYAALHDAIGGAA